MRAGRRWSARLHGLMLHRVVLHRVVLHALHVMTGVRRFAVMVHHVMHLDIAFMCGMIGIGGRRHRMSAMLMAAADRNALLLGVAILCGALRGHRLFPAARNHEQEGRCKGNGVKS
jgi:hypothetical protein